MQSTKIQSTPTENEEIVQFNYVYPNPLPLRVQTLRKSIIIYACLLKIEQGGKNLAKIILKNQSKTLGNT